MSELKDSTILVVGYARTGRAVASALADRVRQIVAIDDAPAKDALQHAEALGVELVVAPNDEALAQAVSRADLVVLSPGVPPSHPVFDLADGSQLVSEIELASTLVDAPIVAITGTNGKTTVTSLVAAMLSASGFRARAVGNIGDPLIDVVGQDLDVAVVEVSSFQLSHTRTFRPRVATWLNFAEDHLDWHADLEEYAAAKARIFAFQTEEDVAVVNAEDEVVCSRARKIAARRVEFGAHSGDYHLDGDFLVGPERERYVSRGELPRAYPHDVLNALAAIATARSFGASMDGCREALRRASLLPHRVEHVARIRDVDYVDDSKATTPSAAACALAAFSSVVLIAGGRNKGLDLRAMRAGVDATGTPKLRAVVAIGEAADEVTSAFEHDVDVRRVDSMRDAVRIAATLAVPGDVVLLSPGCASFDWYRNYEERGKDFARLVRELEAAPVGGTRS